MSNITNQSETTTYKSWVSMKVRCQNPRARRYDRYGGRGIKVCERWQKFENFLADMGERPAGKSLDRINNDGHYEPGNCKWSDRKEQGRNTSKSRIITYEGVTMCATDWALKLGLMPASMWDRMRKYGEQKAIALGAPNPGKQRNAFSVRSRGAMAERGKS